MCVRTKTSYGCGHVYKSTTDCHSSNCYQLDRYHYEKSWDCRSCKSEGANISRGRDGKGRYAQKIMRSTISDSDSSSSEETLTPKYDVSGGMGPWAPPIKEEKTWESPHRKQADDAWLSEHDDRILDLSERFESVRVAERCSRPKYTKGVVDAAPEHPDYDVYDHDDHVFTQVTPSRKQSHYIVPRHIDSRLMRSHSHNQQDRQYSHDSLPDSIPSRRSSPKPRRASIYNAVNAYPDTTYEYDYYNSPSNYKFRKEHHEHHHYTPSRSKPEIYYPLKSYRHGSDYEIAPAPPPPLQISSPAPAVYDYYSPSGSPPGASYQFSDYPYELSQPPPLPPQPQHYIGHQRY